MTPTASAASPLAAARSGDKLVGRLLDRLGVLRARRHDSPSFNPIWQLACDISFALEEGELGQDEIDAAIADSLDRSLDERGAFMGAMLAAPDGEARFAGRLREEARSCDFATFAKRHERPRHGCVFTGHPTFLLDRAQTVRLVRAMTGSEPAGMNDLPDPGGALSLGEEHELALAAIDHARRAAGAIARMVLGAAREVWPDRWQALRPWPIALASWVGYDMDGRTDISWQDCIRLRLAEKRRRLDWYLADLRELAGRPGAPPQVARELAAIIDELDAAHNHSADMLARFSAPLDAPAALADAANRLTAARPGKLVRLEPVIERLGALVPLLGEAPGAIDLAALVAEMAIFRLGIGRIHFRVNATQLHNAVRQRFGPGKTVNLNSRSALGKLNEMCLTVKPLRTNFAALAIETTTAVRQFISMAQILRHIDAESDLRLLIAESERPATVLAAVYFARLFGIADRLDISPLFETPDALDSGERFLEVLFAQPAWREAVRERGRIALQTGFSDAGRFIGQIPASLAIERLQGNMARLAGRFGLADLECLVFNTHGESTGRGAHQGSIAARLDHCLTPWARAQFRNRDLRLFNEVSFQGGDGYLWFSTPDSARALFLHWLDHEQITAGDAVDPFYESSGIALDFYRGVMRFQESVLAMPACHRTLSAFGLALLKPTGSRKARRQFEGVAGERPDLSKIRAIPHNAVLQQLGYPLNVVGGIGRATRSGRELFAEWRHSSRRFSGLMDMVVMARGRASLSTMMAYGALFDGGYWASRPHGRAQRHLTGPCLFLADLLEGDDRHVAALELATRLRVDELLLHRLLAETGEDRKVLESADRDSLALLHALRIALMQALFLKAARIPRFSSRNDISRLDIMELVFELRIPEAVALLREAWPHAPPRPDDFAVDEPSDYPDATAADYAEINRLLIDPMESLHARLLDISVAIANIHRAHG